MPIRITGDHVPKMIWTKSELQIKLFNAKFQCKTSMQNINAKHRCKISIQNLNANLSFRKCSGRAAWTQCLQSVNYRRQIRIIRLSIKATNLSHHVGIDTQLCKSRYVGISERNKAVCLLFANCRGICRNLSKNASSVCTRLDKDKRQR